MIDFESIKAVDPEICDAMRKELTRQREHLELIASENFVSDAVLSAMGSHLTNKYAEGYPGKRYYGGCQYVDIVEDLARERAKALFGAEHANVQPHSGAQANMAVYFAMLEPGDTVMGMNLSHGGHLTHGSPVNMSGKYFHFVPYGVTEEEEIIEEEVEQKPAKTEQEPAKPKKRFFGSKEPAAAAPAEEPKRERKSILNFKGSAAKPEPVKNEKMGSKTINLPIADKLMTVVLLEPVDFNDSPKIADYLRDNQAVVVNYDKTDNVVAKRMTDFISGTVYAIGGSMKKLGRNIVICAPKNVDIDAGEEHELDERGNNPWDK